MNQKIVFIKNQVFSWIYINTLRPIFFLVDAEVIHDQFTFLGKVLGSNFITKFFTRIFFSYSNPRLTQKILGIEFKNPVGLAAGFDKGANLVNILPDVGFGFEEIGSITGEPCEGNPKPRLWRLKESKSLAVYYGLKNEGCEKAYEKLKNMKFIIPIWTSIAKTNSPETADTNKGIEDYIKAYKTLSGIGSISVLNISCPNAFGGQPFHDKEKLEKLLKEISKIKSSKPLLLKLSPDLNKKQLDDIIILSKKYNVKGFICSNLTKENKPVEKDVSYKGGLSGKLVENLSNEQISYIYNKTKGKFIIIGTGGIFSAEDAYKKIKLGASLVQLITGMIYQGPQLISEINQGLVELLEKDRYNNISEAIGKESKLN
ncbi:MAG: quinone-dependent dihydroorotate dehydrogenase [Candidatus Pacearchaeota archaeon]|jgi:dihydroorotate dehydrogenase